MMYVCVSVLHPQSFPYTFLEGRGRLEEEERKGTAAARAGLVPEIYLFIAKPKV